MTDEIATPFGCKRLDDCTAADLEFVIAYRKYLHARFPFPYMEHCRVAIDYMQKLIAAMNAQGVSTVGELDGWMTFAEAMAPRS